MREFRSEADKKSCIAKAVFEERGYYIVNIIDCGIFLTPFTSPYKSLLIHQCTNTKGVYNYTSRMHPYAKDPEDTYAIRFLEIQRKCGLCEKPIPDSIQTLWTLQNADSMDYSVDGDAGFA